MQNLQQNSCLHKSPIRPPKSVKDRQKNLSPIKPEQLKQKSQAPIFQAWKIQLNNERPGSAFKMPSTNFHTTPLTSRTKSPIRINKQCNAQGSTKHLQRTYSIESMDNDTDCVVASLNLEVLNNYNTWNHLTVGKLISSFTFFKYQSLIYHTYLFKLLLSHSNSRNHLTMCKQMIKSK